MRGNKTILACREIAMQSCPAINHVIARIDVRTKIMAGNAGRFFGPQNVFCRQLLGLLYPSPDGGLRDVECAGECRLASSGSYGCGECFEPCHIDGNRIIYIFVNRYF